MVDLERLAYMTRERVIKVEAYLDNAATTRVREEVVEAMVEIFENDYGNPSSLHRMGLIAEKKVKKARKEIADYLKVMQDEIYFTSGGTESNNIALQGIVNKFGKNKKHLITTEIEHASVKNIFKYYETKGYDVSYLKVDAKGYVDLENLKEIIREDTVVVSIMMVNNETGAIQPIKEIASWIKENSDAKIHVDGIQAIGKIPVDLSNLEIDAFTFSGHKFHGPKGIGGVYIKKGLNINTPYKGSGQEHGMRPGTENVPGIIGMAKAISCIKADESNYRNHLQELKERLVKNFNENLDDIVVNSELGERGAPHIVNITFRGIKGEVFLHYLENANIYVSTGAACSSKNKGGSHVLRAMKLTPEEIDSSIRISFSKYNTIEEIDYATEEMSKVVKEIRKIMKR